MSESTIVITKLLNTCSACPSQWYAWDASGQKYYIRFRWGDFEMVTVAGEELSTADTMGRNLVEYCSDDGYDGSMDFERLKEVTAGKVRFDCEEETDTFA